jgi:hypothetical protein
MAESPAVSGVDGQYFNAFKETPAAIASGGPFSYKVDIPDEAIPRMMDLDKPLSEQPSNVKDFMNNRGYTDDNTWDAARWYKNQGDSDSVSEMLNQAGIPGIRYLDGSSRTGLLKQAISPQREAELTARLNQLQKVDLPSAADGATYARISQEQDSLMKELTLSRVPDQTSNYVLFDDQMPRILEKNGKPTGLLSYADEAKKAKNK